MDVRSLDPGEEFASGIFAGISQSDVVLAVIGPGWVEGVPRLSEEGDWVRQELATAIGSGARVVPVLLSGTGMPRSDDLPAALQDLVGLQSYAIDDDHIDRDVKDLLAALSIKRRRRVLVAAGIFILAIGVAVFGMWSNTSAEAGPYYNNTELIFDTSASMAELIPSGSGSQNVDKLAVAQDQVVQYVGRRGGDNLALRTSAYCGSGGELVVPFQTSAVGAIEESLAAVVASGPSFGLADAVIAATGDFNDPEQFPAGTQRQIIVFTSGGDGCESDPAELLAERWDELGEIRLAVEFIGMGMDDADEVNQLQAMARAVDGRAFIVEDQDQLNRVLAQLLDVEPVLRAVDEIIAAGNDIVAPLQELRTALNACDVVAGRSAVVASEEALSAADPALRSLRDRDDRPSYVEVHFAARVWADSLADVNDVGEERTELLADRVGEDPSDEACDDLRRSDEWDEALVRWNDVVDIANNNVRTLGERRDVLIAELDAVLTN